MKYSTFTSDLQASSWLEILHIVTRCLWCVRTTTTECYWLWNLRDQHHSRSFLLSHVLETAATSGRVTFVIHFPVFNGKQSFFPIFVALQRKMPSTSFEVTGCYSRYVSRAQNIGRCGRVSQIPSWIWGGRGKWWKRKRKWKQRGWVEKPRRTVEGKYINGLEENENGTPSYHLWIDPLPHKVWIWHRLANTKLHIKST